METVCLFSYNAAISTQIPTLVRDAILDTILTTKEYAKSQIICVVLQIERVFVCPASIIIVLQRKEHVYTRLRAQIIVYVNNKIILFALNSISLNVLNVLKDAI